MTDGRILKHVKSRYLLNLLTDFAEIWHDDANWAPTSERPLKFRILETDILEKSKKCYISAMAWPIVTKSGMIQKGIRP